MAYESVSDSSLNVKTASGVDRDFVKPDWWGLRLDWSNGWMHARRTWTNTLPSTDKVWLGNSCWVQYKNIL